MEPEPKTEVRELLEFEEDTAGGMMNTEYVALPENATVADAMTAIQSERRAARDAEHDFSGRRGRAAERRGPAGEAVHCVRGDAAHRIWLSETLIQVDVDENQRPGDGDCSTSTICWRCRWWTRDGKLSGAITADDIISVLRHKGDRSGRMLKRFRYQHR